MHNLDVDDNVDDVIVELVGVPPRPAVAAAVAVVVHGAHVHARVRESPEQFHVPRAAAVLADPVREHEHRPRATTRRSGGGLRG